MVKLQTTGRALFLRALELGARQIGPFMAEWELHDRCVTPVRFLLEGSNRKALKAFTNKADASWASSEFPYDWLPRVRQLVRFSKSYALIMTVKCRKCDQCLKERARMWSRRAIAEIAEADRTWFGTITLSPEWHERFAAYARQKARKRLGEDFEALPPGQQFGLRNEFIGREFALMFKRLRKAGLKFRYLLVAEAHKSGLPHYHMLLHEHDGSFVRKVVLDASWKFGFAKWRLVSADGREARYVAKYLTKTAAARVRASLNYGRFQREDCLGKIERSESLNPKGLTSKGEEVSAGAGLIARGNPPDASEAPERSEDAIAAKARAEAYWNWSNVAAKPPATRDPLKSTETHVEKGEL